MAKYIDILIQGDQIALDSAGLPVQITDRDVIAQDVRHMLRESGLLEQLIAERSAAMRRLIFKQIRMLVETDARIIPGTSEINAVTPEELHLTAETEFGPITFGAMA